MVRHPDVQRKAQAEIDLVIRRDRLPTYADRGKLPYTNAVLSEVLRVIPPISASRSSLVLSTIITEDVVLTQPCASPAKTTSTTAATSLKRR